MATACSVRMYNRENGWNQWIDRLVIGKGDFFPTLTKKSPTYLPIRKETQEQGTTKPDRSPVLSCIVPLPYLHVTFLFEEHRG